MGFKLFPIKGRLPLIVAEECEWDIRLEDKFGHPRAHSELMLKARATATTARGSPVMAHPVRSRGTREELKLQLREHVVFRVESVDSGENIFDQSSGINRRAGETNASCSSTS
jgi:hypothetical protein